MHISEISQKSGVEARKAGRILRILASKHIFREGEWTFEQTSSKTDQMDWNTVSKDVFANNRLSIQLLSNNSLSSLGLHLSVVIHFYYYLIAWAYLHWLYSTSTDECVKSAVLLSEVLADKEWGPSYAPHQTAFNKYSGYPDSLFKYFEGVRTFLYIYLNFDPRLNDFAKGNP